MNLEDLVSASGMRLLPFQKDYEIQKLIDQPGVIIGDDMGLGKTVEAIALDLVRRHRRAQYDIERIGHPVKMHTLVICPMSMISEWEDHVREWAPGLSVIAIDRKNRFPFAQAVLKGNYDVYIMHWDVVRLMPELKRRTWFHIIGDEAHRVANRDAQVTYHVKRIPTLFISELTGTPCTARPEQFWSLLNWVKPKRFTSFWRFFNHHVIYVQHSKDYCGVCGKFHKSAYKELVGVAQEDELLNEIRPYFTRRLKEQVLDDLPEKYYRTIKVDLDPRQRRVYDQMKNDMLAWIGEHENEPLAAPQALAKLVRLQQLACAYAEIVPTKVRKRHKHSDYCQVGCNKDWDESIVDKVHLIEPSSKLDAVMEIIESSDKQFVVFSQSKQVIKMLEARLAAKKIPVGILTGDTSQVDRAGIIRAFQGEQLRVFAGTIAAGGVGITLTASSTVIFLDRSWSPAVNKQAEDRLHRIGQKSAVLVIDIVARNTVDLGRLQRLEQSWHFIKKLLGDKDYRAPKPEGAYI